MAWFSAQGLTRLKSGVSWAGLLYGSSGEECASKFIQVTGRIQFLCGDLTFIFILLN